MDTLPTGTSRAPAPPHPAPPPPYSPPHSYMNAGAASPPSVTGHILPRGRYLHPPSEHASSTPYDLPDSASGSVQSHNNNRNTESEYERLQMQGSQYQRLQLT